MVSKMQGESLEALRDAAKLAFYGEEFSLVPESDEPEELGLDIILSASARFKNVWDSGAESMAEVAEFHLLMHNTQTGENYPDHRVAVQWDRGEVYEVELNSGEIIEEDGDPGPIKDKIVHALSAASGMV